MNSSSSPGKQNRVGQRRLSALARMERTHPLLMLLYLGVVGITVLFAILVVAYLQARSWHPPVARPFPRFFGLSTVLLLLSSAVLRPTTRLYRKDNLSRLAQRLGYTLLLGLGFAATQAAGWRELFMAGLPFQGQATGTYVYLISALHLVHLTVGLVFLTYFWVRTRHAAADGVRTLFFIRNPYRRLQLRMLRFYWHYLDALWVALFVLFLFAL